MTNKNLNRSNNTKLPKIGERYKHKDSGFAYWCIPCKIDDEPEQKYQMICESHPHLNIRFSTDCVLDYFEPILYPKEQEEDKVQEAKEKLKEKLKIIDQLHANNCHITIENDLKIASQNLINTLEEKEELDSQKPDKSRDKEVCLSHKESIWKDVSELPEEFLGEVLVKGEDGRITPDYLDGKTLGLYADKFTNKNKYRCFTEFINQQEQTTKRIAELEKKIEQIINQNK